MAVTANLSSPTPIPPHTASIPPESASKVILSAICPRSLHAPSAVSSPLSISSADQYKSASKPTPMEKIRTTIPYLLPQGCAACLPAMAKPIVFPARFSFINSISPLSTAPYAPFAPLRLCGNSLVSARERRTIFSNLVAPLPRQENPSQSVKI